MSTTKQYQPVTVSWVDSCSYDAWHSPGHVKYSPQLCTTRGYLIESTKRHVVVASSLGIEPDGTVSQMCGVMVIPRSCIKKLTKEK